MDTTTNLIIWDRFYSPQLHNTRSLYIALPPSYEHSDQRRYPVLYMHDGQNLFDDQLSYSGAWHVDDALLNISKEAIVVGIGNIGERRVNEYNPFEHERFGAGQGDLYLQFITQTVKTKVDRTFRTLTDRHHTAIFGSSMGGLISLYAFFRYSHIFGLAGAMSPSLWIAKRRMAAVIEQSAFQGGRLYMDIGLQETRRPNFHLGVREMTDLIYRKGYHQQNFMYMEDAHGKHNEADWSRRLPDALHFLLR